MEEKISWVFFSASQIFWKSAVKFYTFHKCVNIPSVGLPCQRWFTVNVPQSTAWIVWHRHGRRTQCLPPRAGGVTVRRGSGITWSVWNMTATNGLPARLWGARPGSPVTADVRDVSRSRNLLWHCGLSRLWIIWTDEQQCKLPFISRHSHDKNLNLNSQLQLMPVWTQINYSWRTKIMERQKEVLSKIVTSPLFPTICHAAVGRVLF